MKSLVKKKIKEAVDNGFIDCGMIMEYIPAFTSKKFSIRNWLNKDTAQYVLDHLFHTNNISEISIAMSLFNMNKNQASIDFLIQKLHDSIDELAKAMNRSEEYNCNNFIQQLGQIEGSERIFQGQFGHFCEVIDNDVFHVSDMIQPPFGPDSYRENLREEYLDFFQRQVKEETIHPTSVVGYIEQLLEDLRDDSKAEKTKALLQELSRPMMKRTNCPMETLSLFNQAGIDVTDARNEMNQRIVAVVREMTGENTSLLDVVNGPEYREEEHSEQEQSEQNGAMKKLTIDELILATCIGEVLKNEKLELADIKFLSKGGFSKVYSIGSKILKCGNTPQTYYIHKNSKRFLQPLMRYSHDDVNHVEVRSAYDPYIEVTEKCDTNIQFASQKEEQEALYQIYRDIRDEGMIWTDVKKENIGRLIRENSPHFEGIDYVDKKFLGFRDGTDVEVLGPGELVLIDLDCIFDAKSPDGREGLDNPNIFWATTAARAFEKRYQEERKQRNEQTQTKEAANKVAETQKGDMDDR